MKSQELEAKVLRIVDTVLTGHKVEDTFVEFKSTWTPASYTARVIAGLCNAARGEDVLLVVGVDENAHRIHKLPVSTEAGQWWASVASNFVELAPDVRMNIVVPIPDHGPVHVFLLETWRAPYVVKVTDRANVQSEVPWREGAQTRSARRSDLLMTLVEQARAPHLDFITGHMQLTKSEDGFVTYWLRADFYLSAVHRVTLPEYRWQATATAAGRTLPMEIASMEGPMQWSQGGGSGGSSSSPNPYANVRCLRGSGLQVDGPDHVSWLASGKWAGEVEEPLSRARRVIVRLDMPTSTGDATAVLEFALQRRAPYAPDHTGPRRVFRAFRSGAEWELVRMICPGGHARTRRPGRASLVERHQGGDGDATIRLVVWRSIVGMRRSVCCRVPWRERASSSGLHDRHLW